ncbi:hypothetical protein [Streptomyces himalayensis]|uniref:hypothetical protein n=1 Tax=Streptomyces himalayensis TaxID=2820085 RepID=UPI0035A848F0
MREAFAYTHRDIAGVLDPSEANSRQLYRRAVQRVATPPARFRPAPEQQRELVALRAGGQLTPNRAVGKGSFEEYPATRFPAER